MTDLSKLSYKELQTLEKQIENQKKIIEEHKKFLSETKNCAVGYEVTFCIKFNPYVHEYNELGNTNSFGDWLANELANVIIKYFDLKLPAEDVSGFDIKEITDEDKKKWEDFWENEKN